MPCAPVRDLLGATSVDDAYVVQTLVHEATGTGRRRLGRKIGLTSPAVQQQMGVDRPDFGVLYADMAFGDGETLPTHRLLQPRIEAEVAFVLARDLPERPVVLSDVIRATDFVLAAIEVVDSRIARWDISIVDTVADNASSALYVLGDQPVALGAVSLGEVGMQMTKNGQIASIGTGAACLGHPLRAAYWLARTMAGRGQGLRAGEVILSGALGPMVAVVAGDLVHARIGALGTVSCRMS